jgi:hypothetical protein
MLKTRDKKRKEKKTNRTIESPYSKKARENHS